MNYRQLLSFPERLERRHRGMQTKEAVEIECRLRIARLRFRDSDVGTQFVIVTLTMRHDHVEAVNGATLKDGDNSLATSTADSIASLRKECSL